MNKIQLILFLTIIPLLMGCLDLQKHDQLEKLGGLSIQVDSIQKMTSSHAIDNIGEIESMIDTIQSKIGNLGDTITIELAVLVDHFKLTSNALNPFLSVQRYLDTNSHLVIKSIENLQKDIENANGARTKYDEYIEFERQKVDSLQAYLDSLILLKSALLDGYENYFSTLNDELSVVNSEVGMNLDSNQ